MSHPKIIKSFFPDEFETTSCLGCGKMFALKGKNLFPYNFCVGICEYRYYYRNLALFEEKAIIKCYNTLFPNKKVAQYSQKVLFNLCKIITKLHLSSIMLLAQGSGSKKVAQKCAEPLTGSKCGSTPPYIGVEPLSHEPASTLAHWFKLEPPKLSQQEVIIT